MSLSAGVWRHYKGGLYLVLGLARLDADDSELVIYCRLYSRSDGGLVLSARSREEFEQEVDWPDGEVAPRFVFVGDAEPASDET